MNFKIALEWVEDQLNFKITDWDERKVSVSVNDV